MLSAGDKIQHYELVRLLGKGGMGEVYLAGDSFLERNVALKFLPDELENDPRMRERFLREAKSAAALDHPFICKIYETGTHQGKGYIAMEYVEGTTLKDRMERERVPLREAIRITLEIGEALENAHKAGIVHRDLKPANIMISHQGHTKVMDFGLAKHVLPGTDAGGMTSTMTQQSITEHGAIAGTIAYMSPEQAKGSTIDARSDIFSLGIILYEMISGSNPFSKPSPIETLTSILRDAAPATHVTPKSMNPVLNPILHKALAKNPDERYAKISDFVADLRKAQQQTFGGGRPVSRLLSLIGAAVVIIVLAVLAIQKFVKPRPTPDAEAETKTVLVLIADVTNQTGDPLLDGVLDQLLGISLGGAENVTLFERKQAISLINRLDPKAEGKLTEENARLLSRREGINAVVGASVGQDKSGYEVKAWATDPVSGKKLAEAEQTIKTKADILKAADVLSAKLRSGLGVIPAGSTEALIKETFTTTSLEAMKEYADAQRMIAMGKTEDAIAAYLRAVDHDPNFGRAFAGLAAAYYNKGDFGSAEKYYKEALDRIEQMNEVEKHRTRGGYYLFKQNFKRAVEEYGALVERNPSDDLGRMNLALAYFFGHKMPEAYEEGLKAIDLAPDVFDNRYNESWYALASGNFDRAREEARKTVELDPTYPKALVVLALVELAQGRPEEAEKFYRQAEATGPSGASYASTGLADLAVYEGRLEEAVAGLKKSIAADIEKKSNYLAADKSLILARALLDQRKKAEAMEAAAQALRMSDLEEILFAASQIFIEAGEEDRARNIAGELSKRVQDIHLAYAKLTGGYLSLARGYAANALKLFDEAQGLVDTWLGRLALGKAYLEAGAFDEALGEFEKCEKRKGEALSVFLNDLPTVRYLDSLDYYLGRAQEGAGNAASAKASYQKFLDIKEKADQGLAMVADARQRLGAL